MREALPKGRLDTEVKLFHSVASDSEGPAVLIAEDEMLIRFALSDCLAERGFRVFEAATASEAIDVLEHEPEIELVFTDIRMPGPINGIDLANWVHAHRPGLPVVLTSGDARKAELAAKITPEEPFIAKPYDVQSVVDKISDIAQAKSK
jgi:DNA-binding NtrC family response regulator